MASLNPTADSIVRSKQIFAQQSEADLPCPTCDFPSGTHSSSSETEADDFVMELSSSLLAE